MFVAQCWLEHTERNLQVFDVLGEVGRAGASGGEVQPGAH